MAPQSFRKTFLFIKPARDWEISISKVREQIYNSEFSKVNDLKEGQGPIVRKKPV